MYCSYCGVELSKKFPSDFVTHSIRPVICNACFIEKHKELIEKNPEVNGFTGYGLSGYSGVSGLSGAVGTSGYSERAVTEKKKLTSKWRMLRLTSPSV